MSQRGPCCLCRKRGDDMCHLSVNRMLEEVFCARVACGAYERNGAVCKKVCLLELASMRRRYISESHYVCAVADGVRSTIGNVGREESAN
eukprot:5997240-Pleurochrysis_carterae.AAC.2